MIQNDCGIQFSCQDAPVFTATELNADDEGSLQFNVDGFSVDCEISFGLGVYAKPTFNYACAVPEYGVLCTGQAIN